MTEISSGYWDPLYGDGKPKVTGPRDAYHEPYPGYWEKEAKKNPVENPETGKAAEKS